jgi:phage terminase small subunit
MSKNDPTAPTPGRGFAATGPKSSKNHGRKRKTPGSSPGSNKNSAPPHLRPDTAAWWASVAVDYALEAHQLRILTLAAEAWDRGVEAREAIAQLGSVYVDRFAQPRARPEVAIERDSRISFARLVRELALDVSEPGGAGRPPRLGGTDKRSDIPIEDAADRRILGLE